MLVTRETDYAIRCVSFLSQRPGYVANISEIAKGTAVSKSFLAKILQKLSKAEIVTSQRGIKGGFNLAKKPGRISVFDVMMAVGGSPAINICAVDKRACDFSQACAIHPLWVDIRKEIEQRLKNADFARLCGLK
jgi:Rrf2 family protein